MRCASRTTSKSSRFSAEKSLDAAFLVAHAHSLNDFISELQRKRCRKSGALHDQHGHRPWNICKMCQRQTDSANAVDQIRGTGCVYEQRISGGDQRSYAINWYKCASVVCRWSSHWRKLNTLTVGLLTACLPAWLSKNGTCRAVNNRRIRIGHSNGISIILIAIAECRTCWTSQRKWWTAANAEAVQGKCWNETISGHLPLLGDHSNLDVFSVLSLQSMNSTYTCQICGGYRLLPCPSCSGSKKSVHRNHFTTEFVALKCMNCDEVGLVKCYSCNWARAQQPSPSKCILEGNPLQTISFLFFLNAFLLNRFLS